MVVLIIGYALPKRAQNEPKMSPKRGQNKSQNSNEVKNGCTRCRIRIGTMQVSFDFELKSDS